MLARTGRRARAALLTAAAVGAVVIGGYQQGGDTPDVSYSPVLGPDAAALYQKAVAAG